ASALRSSMCLSPISCVCSIETTRSRNMRTDPIARRISYVDSAGRKNPSGVRVGREDRAAMRVAGRKPGPEPLPHEPDHGRGEGGHVARRPPRLAGENQLSFGNFSSPGGERFEQDVPALVRPENPAEE